MMKRRYTENRVVAEALIFTTMNKTLDYASEFLEMPRSTLFYHLTVRLPAIDPKLADSATALLQKNKRRKA